MGGPGSGRYKKGSGAKYGEKAPPKTQRKYLKNPPVCYPTEHPLWGEFVTWIESGGVVRRDLLKGRESDWMIIWQTFLGGASRGKGREEDRGVSSVRVEGTEVPSQPG